MQMFLKILIFLLLASPVYADHWVYIRTVDESGVTAKDDVGLSKKGDIVDIRVADYPLSKAEKDEWSIIKVSGLTQDDINKYKEQWVDHEGGFNEDRKAYRKYKIDVDKLHLSIGEDANVKAHDTIRGDIEEKTAQDLVMYRRKQKVYAFFRPFRLALRRLTNYAFAETISIINKAGQDYDTLTLWEDAVNGNLVLETRQETAECYSDDGVLNEKSISIDGSITNATYYMKISVASEDRHDGTAGTGFVIDPSVPGSVINLIDPYSVVEWVEVTDWGGAGWSSIGINIYNDGDYSTVRNCLVHEQVTGNNNYSIKINLATLSYVYNNIVYETNNQGVGIGARGSASNLCYIFNNTVYGMNQGIKDYYDNPEIINNIAYNNTTDFTFAGPVSADSNYNFSKDDTAPGANSIHGDTDGKSIDFISTVGGSEDFHLSSTSDAIGAGIDDPLSKGKYTDDIDGDTRTTVWDMGADEYVGGAPPATPSQTIINIML